MITQAEAFGVVDREVGFIEPESERIPVREARGRILAGDQLSRLDLPPFDKSAMDGYALLEGDEREQYRLIESVAAGGVPGKTLEPGQATKVMTGAPVPGGTGRVLMVERTEERDGVVTVHTPDRSVNICWKGEDIRRGDLILAAPRMLGALEVANLIACGIDEVDVFRRLRVGIITTGDELVDAPGRLGPGKIMNSNGPLLRGLCEENGLEVTGNRLVPDDPTATLAALRAALDEADIVVVSGGVSVGEFDFVGGALREAGLKLGFDRVATKPGKPMTFASAPGRAVFGLPGNPVSVYVMFHLFVMRAVCRMTGLKPGAREVSLPLEKGFARRKTKRRQYVPCRLTAEGAVQPVSYHGSAHLLSLMEADGLFAVPRGVGEFSAGERVTFIPTRGLSR
jgi:molybdopterin molybdotransferase